MTFLGFQAYITRSNSDRSVFHLCGSLGWLGLVRNWETSRWNLWLFGEKERLE